MKGPTHRSWTDDEPDLKVAGSEIARLGRRARLHPVRVLIVSLLLALAVVGIRARTDPLYPARVVLRVTESDRGGSNSPRPKRRLREYVRDAVFSNARLLELVDKYG